MLSVLIPVYNFNVIELTENLIKQAENLKIEFEIFIVDDFSSIYKENNRELKKHENVRYEELPENYGRSKIRNYLALNAKYNFLLFLDCDSGIVKDDFIENYLKNSENDIVYGGTYYKSTPPKNENLLLHWWYGKNREVLSIENRRKEPNKSFKTNNFFIKKDIFNQIKFNETIKGYGHEDTLFGYELKKRNIAVTHIENPVEHLGLDTSVEFIKKTNTAIANLKSILYLSSDNKEFYNDIKLLKYFVRIKKLYLCGLLRILYFLFNKLIQRNLHSKKPSLFLLDVYKILFLCNIK